MKPRIVYLQKRTSRSGAQTCLARIFSDPGLAAYKPILVCGQDSGWLWQAAKEAGIESLAAPFPNSRTIHARLWGNRLFANKVANRLLQISPGPFIIHANDHQEALLGELIANRLNANKAIFLRSAGMTKSDYFKYRCPHYQMMSSVSDLLIDRIRAWDPDNTVHLIHDGIAEHEFLPAITKPDRFPGKLLVIGSADKAKGWSDLIDALVKLEHTPKFPGLELHFTGNKPDPHQNDLGLSRLEKTRYQFLGHVDDFIDLVRQYDLVINPSRQETFGMAAIEVVAAGIPLISSRTGVIETVLDPPFLFEPFDPDDMANTIAGLFSNWDSIDWDASIFQQRVKERFLIEKTVSKLIFLYEELAMTSVKSRSLR